MKSEPILVIVGGVQAVVVAVLGVLFAFTHFTNAQQGALATAVQAVGALVAIVLARRQTFSPETVEKDYVEKAALEELAAAPPRVTRAAAKKARRVMALLACDGGYSIGAGIGTGLPILALCAFAAVVARGWPGGRG